MAWCVVCPRVASWGSLKMKVRAARSGWRVESSSGRAGAICKRGPGVSLRTVRCSYAADSLPSAHMLTDAHHHFRQMGIERAIVAPLWVCDYDHPSVTSKPTRAIVGRGFYYSGARGEDWIANPPRQIHALMLSRDGAILDTTAGAKWRVDRPKNRSMSAASA